MRLYGLSIFLISELVTLRADRGLLMNHVFQNFDLKCLPTETISGLTYKKFVSSNGTGDFEFSILCRSVAGTGGPDASATESDCRYGEKFRFSNPTEATDTDCKAGEYISGIAGTFEKSYRLLRLRCCKAANSHVDSAIGCRTVGPESVGAVAVSGIKDPSQVKSGCPRNVLSSFSAVRSKLTAKFCALDLDGAKYEQYCYTQNDSPILSDPKIEESVDSPVSSASQSPWNQFNALDIVEKGKETEYGQQFRVECGPNEGVDHFECRSVNGSGGPDLLYKIFCANVTTGAQKAIHKKITRMVRINDTAILSCGDNETLCGFYGSFNRSKPHKRHYAFACCEGSNWYSVPGASVETNSAIGEKGDKAVIAAPNGATAAGYKIKTFSILMTDHQTTIAATFQSYRYDSTARFSDNITLYENTSPKAR